MAWTYQDFVTFPAATTPFNDPAINDISVVGNDIYLCVNQTGIAIYKTDLTLSNFSSFITTTGNFYSLTNDGTHLYATVFEPSLVIRKYLISDGSLVTSWTPRSSENQLYVIGYNSDNDQVYAFRASINPTTRPIEYVRYSNTGTLLDTTIQIALQSPAQGIQTGATYDSDRNRFHYSGGASLYQFTIGSDHQLTQVTDDPVPTPTGGWFFRRGISYSNNTLRVLADDSSRGNRNARLYRFTAPAPNIAPTVETAIVDQMVAATTSTDIELNDVFSGTPQPTYAITSGAQSWISISGSTLTIAPLVAQVRTQVYPVTITATNSEGSIADTFNITVTTAPPRATAVITDQTDATAETVTFTIAWSNVTDYAGFDADDISASVTSTRQAGVLSPRTGNTYTYTVYPTADTDGTAQITIRANAFTTPPSGGANQAQSSAVVRYAFAPVPANSQYRITIPIPDDEAGTLHVVMKPRSVNANMILGPDTESYLGSFQYDRVIIPDLVRIDRPDNLRNGDNNILLDWNTPVKGVTADQFHFDGIPNITAVTATVFFAATPDPDVPPDADTRSTPVVGLDQPIPTREKYYKLVVNIPDDTALTGSLDIYIRSDTSITNDP